MAVASIKAKRRRYSGALQTASESGHYQFVQPLLRMEADVNTVNSHYGGTAPEPAAYSGCYGFAQPLENGDVDAAVAVWAAS